MTYEEYVANVADVSWMYTASGNIAYAGRVYGFSVERVSATLCRVSYTAEMVTKGGDNAIYKCRWSAGPNDDTITDYQWHGQIENGYVYTNTFVHEFACTAAQTSKSLSFQFFMQDASGNQAWSNSFSKTVSFSAWTSYTISYNANGGIGAPSSQTKYKDVSIVLSSTKPSRTGYKFLNWNTSSGGTGTSYNAGGSYSANKSVTLYAQWQAQTSILTTPITVTAGTASTISWTRYDSSYTHTLTYKFVNASGTIGSSMTSASKSWTPALSLCAQIPNGTSGSGTLTLKTYSGSTLIGTSTATFTLKVPSSVVPSIKTYTFSEGTASGFGTYCTNLSTLKAVITTSGNQSSVVKTASLTIDGKTYSGNVSNNSVTLTTATLTNKGSRSITIKITDSRGRTATATASITVSEWFQPKISSFTVDVSGTTATIKLTGSIASLTGNKSTLTITQKKLSDGTTTSIYSTSSGGTEGTSISKTISHTETDYDTETYEYTASLKDNKATTTQAIPTGVICISRYAGGKGVAFFGEADQEGFCIFNNGTKLNYSITASQWSTLASWADLTSSMTLGDLLIKIKNKIG